MDETADDLIGKHLRAMAAEGMTLKQAADALRMDYRVVYQRARRRGIKFKLSDGNEARATTWATKLAPAELISPPDEAARSELHHALADLRKAQKDGARPARLSERAVAALYRGRRYNRPETWAK